MRLIEVQVNGYHLTKDNSVAGVQGEVNAGSLRIEFDEGWDGFAKTITWWDAKGEQPTVRVLTADLLTDIKESTRIYLAPIPGEAMTVPGKCMFGIDGWISGRRCKSAYGALVVKPDPSAQEPEVEEPTPSQVEQLQQQIDTLLGDIQSAAGQAETAAEEAGAAQEAAESARALAETAQEAAEAAQSLAEASAEAAAEAETGAEMAQGLAETAQQGAEAAQTRAEAARQGAESARDAAQTAASTAEDAKDTAVTCADTAQTAAENAESSAASAAQSAQSASESCTEATASAGSATAAAASAAASKAAAELAQAAAEQAKGDAQEIAGGDFATKTEAQGYANDAEIAAKSYADEKVEALDIPDASGMVATHNTGTTAHQDIRQAIQSHTADTDNPHEVTAAQVGADPSGSAAAVQTNLNTHTADKSNPHEVTAAQVGLGNVDNTADEDKPVSTAQAAAIATAKSEAIAASASAQHTHAASDITSGTVPIARGGTGATTAEAARTNLEITPGNIGAATTDELDAVRRKVSGPSTFQRLIGWRFV